MTDPWQKKWDSRYRNKEYAFGISPNEFLKEQLDKLSPGKILFAAEGEGRNAVYAAKKGWQAYAFDISEEGKNKAVRLADTNNVSIDYQIGQLPELDYIEASFDAVALIYAHFPPAIKKPYHLMLSKLLKKGGTVIFEAFGKNHLPYRQQNDKIGGPKDLASLYSTDELKTYFPGFDILLLEEKETELNEGLYHNGKGSVTRFVGRKEK